MKRLRLLAGPNGSGKSTILGRLRDEGFSIGVTVNADEIEARLKRDGQIDLRTFGIPTSDSIDFTALGLIGEVTSYLSKIRCGHICELVVQREGLLVPNIPKIDSYYAAIIANLIRYHLARKG
jgi:GTPase SAR1 family protein